MDGERNKGGREEGRQAGRQAMNHQAQPISLTFNS